MVQSTLGDELSLVRRAMLAIEESGTDKKKITQGSVMLYLGIPVGRSKDSKKSASKTKKGMNQGNISVSASS